MTVLNIHVTTQLKCHVTFGVGPPNFGGHGPCESGDKTFFIYHVATTSKCHVSLWVGPLSYIVTLLGLVSIGLIELGIMAFAVSVPIPIPIPMPRFTNDPSGGCFLTKLFLVRTVIPKVSLGHM